MYAAYLDENYPFVFPISGMLSESLCRQIYGSVGVGCDAAYRDNVVNEYTCLQL